MNRFEIGKSVRFAPKEGWLEDYSPDGVTPGCIGVVKHNSFDDDVVVDFTREDGTVCHGFFAFIEDVEAVDE